VRSLSGPLPLPKPRVQELLVFAARGMRDTRVKVDVEFDAELRRSRPFGWGWFRFRDFKGREHYQVHLRVPAFKPFHHYAERPYAERRFPKGAAVETLEDGIVLAAAGAFRRVHHLRRINAKARWNSTDRQERPNEQETFAFRRLSEWRVSTGREPLDEQAGERPAALVKHLEQRAENKRRRRAPVAVNRFEGLRTEERVEAGDWKDGRPWRVKIKRRDGSEWEHVYPSRDKAHEAYAELLPAPFTVSGSCEPAKERA
jgi:hypothetical protein